MTNLFLKINKDLFKLELNPTEILVLAQIMEFNTNTGDCFITDKQLAEQFGVSESTITREMKKLETMGFITRETKNVKGGKERHIKANLTKIEEKLTTVCLSVDCEEKQDLQQSNCLLTTINSPIDKVQNDLIKDNIKNKIKDNIRAFSDKSENTQESEPEAKGTISNPIVVEKEWLIERYNELTSLANGLFKYNNLFYKIKAE